MFKSFTFSILAIMLVISILAPSIEALCNSSYDTIIVMDVNEEDNNKEVEKKYGEKELFFTNFQENLHLISFLDTKESQVYLMPSSDFLNDIILPPPKNLI